MTHVDTSRSRFSEAPSAKAEFNRTERRHCQTILRRLQFLEQNINKTGGMSAPGAPPAAAWAEWEAAGLEWLLSEVGYLLVTDAPAEPAVSGNTPTQKEKR